MTEADATALVNAVVDGVTKDRQLDLLEQYKQMSRLEIDLAKARDDAARASSDNSALIARKDAYITSLLAHIEKLSSMVTALVPGQVHFQTTDVTTVSIPSFTDRMAASVPVPMMIPPLPSPAGE
jgi:hypothetical protein